MAAPLPPTPVPGLGSSLQIQLYSPRGRRAGRGELRREAVLHRDESFGASIHSPAPQPEERTGPKRLLISPQPRTTPEGGDSETNAGQRNVLLFSAASLIRSFRQDVEPSSTPSFTRYSLGFSYIDQGRRKYVRTSLRRGGCRRSGISAPNVNPPEVERAFKKKRPLYLRSFKLMWPSRSIFSLRRFGNDYNKMARVMAGSHMQFGSFSFLALHCLACTPKFASLHLAPV